MDQFCTDFWIDACTEYPAISKAALRVLIPFATSYMCEAGFSAVAVIKTKYHSKLDVERKMRVAVSNVTRRFEALCQSKRANVSHEVKINKNVCNICEAVSRLIFFAR